MDAKLKRRVASIDRLYKHVLLVASPAERRLLVRAHSNLDQMISAARDVNSKILSKLKKNQDHIFSELDDTLKVLERLRDESQ